MGINNRRIQQFCRELSNHLEAYFQFHFPANTLCRDDIFWTATKLRDRQLRRRRLILFFSPK
jgi:hypothetical protein